MGEGDGLEHGAARRYPEAGRSAGVREAGERPVAELDLDVAALAVAPRLDRDGAARVEQRDGAREVVGVVDRPAVDAA